MTNLNPPANQTEGEAKSPRLRRVKYHDQKLKQYPMAQIPHGLEVLLRLDQLDLLTASQVSKMLFWGELSQQGTAWNLKQAQDTTNRQCLRKLKNNRLIEVIPIGEKPDRYTLRRHEFNVLTAAGSRYLAEYFAGLGIPYRPNWNRDVADKAPMNYVHDLWLNEALANLIGALRLDGYEMVRVIGPRALRYIIEHGQTTMGPMRPDAMLVMSRGGEPVTFLIELDTGTMAPRGMLPNQFESKLPKYAEYFTKRFATDTLFAGLNRPRVLVITLGGPQRAHNLKKVILDAGGRRSYWVTTLEWIAPPDHLATETSWLVPTLEGFQPL